LGEVRSTRLIISFDDVQVLIFGKITGFLTEELIELCGSKYFLIKNIEKV